MTTEEAARIYERTHVHRWSGVPNAVFNPHGKPVEDLPAIYGFNNGGPAGLLSAVAIAADGVVLGGHACSSEAYMPSDLGMLEGSRPDRHKDDFQKHFPDGYRCEFVPSNQFATHDGLQAAIQNNYQRSKQQPQEEKTIQR